MFAYSQTTSFFFLYIFYGICTIITSITPYYSIIVFLSLVFLKLLADWGLNLLELSAYYLAGHLIGLLINVLLRTSHLENSRQIFRHKEEILIHFLQLIFAFLVFLPLNEQHESGFPVEIFVMFLHYTLYSIVLFLFNYHYYKLREKSAEKKAQFKRTNLYRYFSMLPVFIFTFLGLEPILVVLLALLILLIFILILKCLNR